MTLGVTEPFVTTFTVAGYAALLLSLPFLLYQAYAFVLPAFSPRERKVALPLMLMVPALFLAGVAFGYFVALPRAIHFLQNFNDGNFDILIRATDYYKFSIVLIALIGLLFQIPVGVLAVTRLGIISARQLAQEPRLRDPGHRGGRRGGHADARPGDDAHRDGAAARASSSSASCSPGSSSAAARGGRAGRTLGPRRRPVPILDSMLFDLRGRGRRRTVQVIYLSLAILMGGGLVLFGIGGGTNGGLFDAIGGNGEQQHEHRHGLPGSPRRLRAPAQGQPAERRPPSSGMTKLRFGNASTGENFNQTQGAYTAKGLAELRQASAAWQRYLATNPRQARRRARPTSWSRPTAPPASSSTTRPSRRWRP